MGSSKNKIEARILKGFRDELPADAEARNRLFRTITEMFELSGFSPIDTPALEYSEILLGKGSDETDKQLFRFQDQGGRDVSLRFDLTVPLARFVSMHQNDLIFPFKRYHIAPVWRAEKPQKGRYREFYQCDFDIIGSKSVTSDLEVLLVVHRFFSSLNIPYRVRVNNRKLLTGMLEAFGVSGDHTPSLRAIDKLEKLGKDKVIDELCSEASLTRDGASGLCDFISDLMHESDIDAGIRILKDRCPENALMEAGLRRFRNCFPGLRKPVSAKIALFLISLSQEDLITIPVWCLRRSFLSYRALVLSAPVDAMTIWLLSLPAENSRGGRFCRHRSPACCAQRAAT
jgi:histidyl-tRNA synthetase